MTVSPPLPPAPPTATRPAGNARPTNEIIDASCRFPVTLLFLAGVLWLALGSLLGVVSAIKMHAPGFLANSAWLTYGRVRPASLNALIYGFGLQAGLGVALWMTCRLGRNILQGGLAIAVGAVLWNSALLAGVTLILEGGSTGYEWLEVPGRLTPLLFCAYALMGIWTLITIHARQERPLYVSQWFLLTALLWFPWIYSTAELLLVFSPVRGVLQAVVNGWYIHNFFELCFASLGLAQVFYFIPKLLRRPLFSAPLALTGYWLLVFFGGWGGSRMGDPVPNWISGVGGSARILMLVPILAFAVCWYRTCQGSSPSGQRSAEAEPLLRFFWVAAVSYLLVEVLQALFVLPGVNRITQFTLFDQGLNQLRIHGFLLMASAGSLYFIAPRLAGCQWPWPRLISFHFWCAIIGIVLVAASLIIGGILQGNGINDSRVDFMAVVHRTMPFLGMSTLGVSFLFVSYATFLAHLCRLLAVNCPCEALIASLQRCLANSNGSRGAKP